MRFSDESMCKSALMQVVKGSAWLVQVEEAKRLRDGKPWSDEEQAAFKAQIADRCE